MFLAEGGLKGKGAAARLSSASSKGSPENAGLPGQAAPRAGVGFTLLNLDTPLFF